MRKLTLSTFILASLFTGAACVASADVASTQLGHAYLNLQLGGGAMQTGTSQSATYAGSKVETGGFGYRVGGGYLFDLNNQFELGPEVGYIGYADNHYSVENSDGSFTDVLDYSGYTIDLLANATFHFNRHWYVIGKAGFASVNQTVTLVGADSVSKNKTFPELAFGAGIDFNPHFGVDTTFSTTIGGKKPDPFAQDDTSTDDSSVANVATMLVGVHYNFS